MPRHCVCGDSQAGRASEQPGEARGLNLPGGICAESHYPPGTCGSAASVTAAQVRKLDQIGQVQLLAQPMFWQAVPMP